MLPEIHQPNALSGHQEGGNSGPSLLSKCNSVVLGEISASATVLVPVSRECEKVPVHARAREKTESSTEDCTVSHSPTPGILLQN